MHKVRRRHSPATLVALWGDEHPRLGEHAVKTVGQEMAVALSAGRFPKPYWHLDPNEDAVLAAEGPSLRLLAVADGHNGFDAAEAALDAIRTAWVDAIADMALDPGPKVRVLMHVAREAVRQAVAELEPPRDASRTALTLALVTPTHVHSATWGDTAAVLIRHAAHFGRPPTARLDRSGPFLGPDSELVEVRTSRVSAGDVVLVASDGLTGFLSRRWVRTISEAWAPGIPVQTGIERLLSMALLAGAGDHVSLGAAEVPTGQHHGGMPRAGHDHSYGERN